MRLTAEYAGGYYKHQFKYIFHAYVFVRPGIALYTKRKKAAV